MKKTWAAALIGRPWTPEENCWWLVRTFLRIRYQIEVPLIAGSDFAEHVNIAAIKAATGWLRAEGEPEEDDIVFLRTPLWRRHAGVMIATSKGLLLLVHADGFMTVDGPVGSVVAQAQTELRSIGFREAELWRKP